MTTTINQQSTLAKRRARWSAVPLPEPVCPYCNEKAVLVDSAIVYGRSYGVIWRCPQTCDAYVGVHKGSNAPLGTLANAELRAWRRKAHAAFDPLWQSGEMGRQEAYWWLCEQMGLAKSQAHIAMFGVEQCRWVIRLVAQRKKSPTS